jgi:phosphatidate cytidylyltransferase
LLKTRILTALVLVPTVLATVFFAPGWLFKLALTALLLTGSWEFRRLGNLHQQTGWILFGLQTVLIVLMYFNWEFCSTHASTVLAVACVAWLLMFSRLYGFRDGQETGPRYQSVSFISALVTISSCWFAIAWLRDRPDGEYLILLLLFIIWAADVGAYFSGRQFGRTRLAPSISPKKTWEGVIGGIALAAIAASLLKELTPISDTNTLAFLCLTAVTVMTSIGGDLFISIHKRSVNLKDAGKVFPGHGGVLDRFDSLLPGATFFAMAVWILGT